MQGLNRLFEQGLQDFVTHRLLFVSEPTVTRNRLFHIKTIRFVPVNDHIMGLIDNYINFLGEPWNAKVPLGPLDGELGGADHERVRREVREEVDW